MASTPPLCHPAGKGLFCFCLAIIVCGGCAWQQQYPAQEQQGYWTSPSYPRSPPSWPPYQNGGAWGPAGYGSPSSPGWNQQPVPPTYHQVTPHQPPVPPPYQPAPPTHQYPVLPPPQQDAIPDQQQVISTPGWDPSAAEEYEWSNAPAPTTPGWEQPLPAPHDRAHQGYQGHQGHQRHHQGQHNHQGQYNHQGQHTDPGQYQYNHQGQHDPQGQQATPHHGWDHPMLWDPSWEQHDNEHDEEPPMRPTRSNAPPSWVQNPNLARPIGIVILDDRTRVPVRDYRLILEHYLQGAWRNVLSPSGARIASSDFGEFERSARKSPVQVRVSAHATVPATTYCQVVRSAQNPGRTRAILELPDGTTRALHELAGRAEMTAWLRALFPKGLVPSRHHGTPHVWSPAVTSRSPTTTPPPRARETNVTSPTGSPEESRSPDRDQRPPLADSSTPRPPPPNPAWKPAPSAGSYPALAGAPQHHAASRSPRGPTVWSPHMTASSQAHTAADNIRNRQSN
ncbi:protein piccolo-like isoform X2 [Frankliniella occidentalis]|uniref:Protein piccolo-like isoform X2 n=1 Tax=Frankliniella occidentalis TaxID=133901 RepID=A0A9C6U6C9_FRAOC|nr:protein piccolo-like isoform X2 [Frankliniella occidentalis]